LWICSSEALSQGSQLGMAGPPKKMRFSIRLLWRRDMKPVFWLEMGFFLKF